MKFFTPIPLLKILSVIQSISYHIIGDTNSVVYGMDDYRIALSNELTWVDYPPYFREAFASKASVVIINTIPQEVPVDKVLVILDDPKKVFDKIAGVFYRNQFPPSNIFDKIFYPKNIHKGRNCQIHRTVTIGRDVFIGDNVTIEPNVVIYDNVFIGNNTTIRAGSVIGAQPFAYTKRSDTGEWEQRKAFGNVIIMDNVDILALNTIERGITGSTIIGSGTKTGCQVLISHDVWIGRNCYLCGNVSIGGYARISNNCTFWGCAGVANSVSLAHSTTIQSSSVVHQSVKKPGRTLSGIPAQDTEKYWHRKAIMNMLINDYELSSK